jgi:hypothetical protein
MHLSRLIISVVLGSLPLMTTALVPNRRNLNSTVITGTALNTTSVLAPAGGFTSTCRAIHGDGSDSHLIWACCQAFNQAEWWETYIDMSNCLENQFGDMRWAKAGNFGPSCNSCRLFDTQNRYECSCYNSVFSRWQTDSVILVRPSNLYYLYGPKR